MFMSRFWHSLTLFMFQKAKKLTLNFSKIRFCKTSVVAASCAALAAAKGTSLLVFQLGKHSGSGRKGETGSRFLGILTESANTASNLCKNTKIHPTNYFPPVPVSSNRTLRLSASTRPGRSSGNYQCIFRDEGESTGGFDSGKIGWDVLSKLQIAPTPEKP